MVINEKIDTPYTTSVSTGTWESSNKFGGFLTMYSSVNITRFLYMMVRYSSSDKPDYCYSERFMATI